MDKGSGLRGGNDRGVKGARDNAPCAEGVVIKGEDINGGKGMRVTHTITRKGNEAKCRRAGIGGRARLVEKDRRIKARAAHKPNNRDGVGVPIFIIPTLLCMRKFGGYPYMHLVHKTTWNG